MTPGSQTVIVQKVMVHIVVVHIVVVHIVVTRVVMSHTAEGQREVNQRDVVPVVGTLVVNLNQRRISLTSGTSGHRVTDEVPLIERVLVDMTEPSLDAAITGSLITTRTLIPHTLQNQNYLHLAPSHIIQPQNQLPSQLPHKQQHVKTHQQNNQQPRVQQHCQQQENHCQQQQN